MFRDAHPTEGKPANFKGSVMVFRAATEAEVRDILSNDVYSKGNVWDLENLQIIPVSPLTPSPFTGCREKYSVDIDFVCVDCHCCLNMTITIPCISNCSRIGPCHIQEGIQRCITC